MHTPRRPSDAGAGTHVGAVGEAEAGEPAPRLSRGGGDEGGEQTRGAVGFVGQLQGAELGALGVVVVVVWVVVVAGLFLLLDGWVMVCGKYMYMPFLNEHHTGPRLSPLSSSQLTAATISIISSSLRRYSPVSSSASSSWPRPRRAKASMAGFPNAWPHHRRRKTLREGGLGGKGPSPSLSSGEGGRRGRGRPPRSVRAPGRVPPR